ncbi:hypothetical protein EIP91_009251, partial [Steccherinum ochraceum]
MNPHSDSLEDDDVDVSDLLNDLTVHLKQDKQRLQHDRKLCARVSCPAPFAASTSQRSWSSSATTALSSSSIEQPQSISGSAAYASNTDCTVYCFTTSSSRIASTSASSTSSSVHSPEFLQ